jgi:hypothetical protein
MILSFSQRFLFVKTRKTGGTSVEIALSRICQQDDIISLITPIDEYIRLQEGRGFQNCLACITLEQRYAQLLRESDPPLRKIPKDIKSAQIFYNHMPLADIYRFAKLDGSGFFKFTIERHPYDKAVSYANFHMGYRRYTTGHSMCVALEEIPPEIDRLIEAGKLREKIQNYRLYSIDEKVGVDRIMRYERLDDDFRDVLRELGFPGTADLPFVKVGQRDKSVPAKELLTGTQRRWIQEVCAAEFELLGYES